MSNLAYLLDITNIMHVSSWQLPKSIHKWARDVQFKSCNNRNKSILFCSDMMRGRFNINFFFFCSTFWTLIWIKINQFNPSSESKNPLFNRKKWQISLINFVSTTKIVTREQTAASCDRRPDSMIILHRTRWPYFLPTKVKASQDIQQINLVY